MTTVTRDGVTYEVEDGWESRTNPPKRECEYVNVLWSDGAITSSMFSVIAWQLGPNWPIAWRHIVKPKEVRWRAERDHFYWFVTVLGNAQSDKEVGYEIDDARYACGNYFRTREEAEASNKARVMRDPESERCQ